MVTSGGAEWLSVEKEDRHGSSSVNLRINISKVVSNYEQMAQGSKESLSHISQKEYRQPNSHHKTGMTSLNPIGRQRDKSKTFKRQELLPQDNMKHLSTFCRL